MDQAKYMIVDVLISQPETVTVTETYSMSVARVADQVSQPVIVIATETCSMSVARVADQVSQPETVIAMETY
jgi:3-hydroxyacyl-CoA dehydrogenase